jgi:hypothetical protein
MSEKRARQNRAAPANLPAPVEQPGKSPTATVADLLQLLGSRDVEIMTLQRQVAGLEQQVRMQAERLAKNAKKGEE